jgi:polysaccharide chain length determinant protein (PEP-CTERM system associated)
MAGAVQHQVPDLSELADFLRGMLWGCWRFRWTAIGVAWGVCLAGWTMVALMPDIHQASARVYIDTQSALRPLLQGLAVNSDVLTDVNMMERAIMSRPNLESLARETDLDVQAKDRSAFEALINQLQASIQLERDGKDIVKISYQNHDAGKALAVVTALLNNFIEGSLGKNRSNSTSAEKFLVDKLKDYEARLNEAEGNLAEFKRKNVGLMPGQGSDYFASLQTEQAKLQQIDVKLRAARNRKAELQRQIEGEEPVFGLIPADEKADLATSSEDRQIAQFEQQLAELRLKYTETHPDIVQIKRTIAELRAQKAEAAAKAGLTTRRAYSPLDLNPVYQQMKLQLSQVEVDLAQLQAEYADQSAVVGSLRRKVDTVPAIEAELKRLTRDYDVTKTQYDELLRRVESARLSDDAEQSKSDITFRIIDPPAVPSTPVGPHRKLLMTGVLIFALLVGAALSVARNLMKPVFYTGKDLERRFGVPVIGAIRIVRSDIETAVVRQKARLVAISFAALVVCYGLLLTFATSSGSGTGDSMRGAFGL